MIENPFNNECDITPMSNLYDILKNNDVYYCINSDNIYIKKEDLVIVDDSSSIDEYDEDGYIYSDMDTEVQLPEVFIFTCDDIPKIIQCFHSWVKQYFKVGSLMFDMLGNNPRWMWDCAEKAYIDYISSISFPDSTQTLDILKMEMFKVFSNLEGYDGRKHSKRDIW